MLIRRSIIVILSLIGATLLFACIIFITGTITLFSRSPADFLPQEETIALLNNVTQKEINEIMKFIPSLPKDYSIEEEKIVAILRNKLNKVETIEFAWKGFKAPKGKYWPYVVTSTSINLEEILTTRINSLAKLPAYREFARKKNIKQPWVYAQKNSISQSGTLTQNFLKNIIFQDAEYIAIFKNDLSQWAIETFGNSQTSHKNIQKAYKAKKENIISLSIFNPSELFQKAKAELITDKETFLSSVIRTKINKIFGPIISFNFDILPLFEKNTILNIETTASGKTIFVVSGEMDNIEKLNKTIEKLHIGRINVLPSIELINQKLDNRFSIKTLRSTPKKEHLAESTYKNWSIYEAEEETDFGFFSAQTGNKFVLANNKEMLLRHLNPTSERINIDETKTLIRSTSESLGEINISSIKNLIEKLLPEEKDDNEFPSLPLGSGSILWSQEKRGSVSVWKFWNK